MVCRLAGLETVTSEPSAGDSSSQSQSPPTSPTLRLDSSAPLFPHIPALFYVLHLLYQEMQLNDLQRGGARALVSLLQQLAR